ncbi:MAG: CRTAC1 family protein [Balneolaceae bacterium]|nr:CRTAC1 family protein [Balneolaceae bacterium]
MGTRIFILANGYVSAEKGTDYWYDFSKVAGGNRVIIRDAKNWPAMKGRSLSGFQDNKIWLNDGAGRFQEVADAVNGDLGLDSRAVAFADFFNDGSLDIVVASQGGPVKIYKNTIKSSHHWLGFKLEGTSSNHSAIGAEVEVFWNEKRQLQVVSGGSGFSAQNQRPVYFGLGENAEIQKVEIKWPSGILQIIESPDTDTLITVTEPQHES